MTKDARIAELNRELNEMDDTLSGCDWCEECGGGIIHYNKALQELRDLEGAYLRIWKDEDGTTRTGIKYDYTSKD